MKQVIIDCDPGDDDAVAIFIALASEKLNVLGITTVAGNAPLPLVFDNARRIVELAKKPHIRVFAGCARPLIRPPVSGAHVHGASGIDGATLSEATSLPESLHAVDFIINTLMSSFQKITIAATASLTNLALALIKEPKIIDKINEVIWFGGSTTTGNITPAAEYNAHTDPHAAHVILTSGINITLIGLQVSHHVLMTKDKIKALQNRGTKVCDEVAKMLTHTEKWDREQYNLEGRAVHDACVVSYLLQPDLFTVEKAHVQIEMSEGPTCGATIISTLPVHRDNRPTYVITGVNSQGVINLIFDHLSRYSDEK